MTMMIIGEDSITAMTNPLLKGFIEAVLIGKGSLEGSGGICVSTYMSGANPSWARMLLTQPPISNFIASLNFYKYATRTILVPTGLKSQYFIPEKLLDIFVVDALRLPFTSGISCCRTG